MSEEKKTMSLEEFDYDLPKELIAQDPLEKRDDSRLLVLDKNTGEYKHQHFYDIRKFLRPGDCLVINNTKVMPARLIGEKEGTGGKVEVLLLTRKSDTTWETLVKRRATRSTPSAAASQARSNLNGSFPSRRTKNSYSDGSTFPA